MPCQALVAALGFVADLGALQQWGLETHKRHIVVNTEMRTNLSGCSPPATSPKILAVRLIAVGSGEAATAVNNARGRSRSTRPPTSSPTLERAS